MENYLKLLGHAVEDRVTKFKGVATAVSFELFGCIQVVVTPAVKKDGKPEESRYFDFHRLKKTANYPVMKQPVFPLLNAPIKGGDRYKPAPRN